MKLTVVLGASQEASFDITLNDNKFTRKWVEQLRWCVTHCEFNQLESIIEESYPEGIDETELNDLFWHDSETIADWLGTTEEEILNRSNEEEQNT